MLNLSATRQLPVCSLCVNLWHKNVIIIMKTTDALFVSSEDISVEVQREKLYSFLVA